MANSTSTRGFTACNLPQREVSSGLFSRLDFLITKLITSKTERCFVNFHVRFSCGSSGGQWASTTCRIVSVEGIHDLEPIQKMMIYRTNPPAQLVLIARPGQSYSHSKRRLKAKAHLKSLQRGAKHVSRAPQWCVSRWWICSLARSCLWYSVSPGPFQWNWDLWHLCATFGFHRWS